jgi:hypothetical protein
MLIKGHSRKATIVRRITYKINMNFISKRLLLIIFLTVVWAVGHIHASQRKFPDGFIFGAATSAYQVEGAWNETGESQFKRSETKPLASAIVCQPYRK